MKKLKLEELGRLTPEEYKEKTKISLSIVLDNIRSMHNVGASFRTSDAFLIEKIYLCGITATPPHREIHKTALGAQDTVSWEHHADTAELIKSLKAEGKTIVAVEQADKSTMIDEFIVDPSQSYVLVFGNEVEGVSEQAFNLSDFCVEIPQFGTKHSLNVSVSMGIVLWEFVKKYNK